MTRTGTSWAVMALLLSLSGCMNLAPQHQRPELQLPPAAGLDATASASASTPASAPAPATAPLPGWRELVRDERLREVVNLALANNQDVKIAALAVEQTRAQLRLADADRWPTVSAALSANRAPSSSTGVQTTTLQAGLQVSAWELDLFGRLANASEAANAAWLSSQAAARSARLALVAQTVSAWLTLAADTEQLTLAQRTLKDRQATQALAELRLKVGALSELDWRGVQSLSAAAQASVAQAQRQRAADLNALQQLVGAAVPAQYLPAEGATGFADNTWLAEVPANLSSEVLQARPDVIQAEQQLRAAQANIGAAKAAVYPRITLSTSAGVVSDTLSGLVSSGTFAWTLAGQAAVSVFDFGRNQANVRVAEISRDMAIAQYQKTAQTAFKEAADALVAQATWQDQAKAQRLQLAAERERHRLTRLKLDAGAISQLDWLDAERSLAAAEQALVQVQLAQWLNRVGLYKALGGEVAGG
jgi:multidrug efflux system outer membrane protein